MSSNDRGIDVDKSGNLIVRNSAWGNTVNYSISVNNKLGLIITPADSGAVSGDSGGGFSLGTSASDSPWVNFVLDQGD